MKKDDEEIDHDNSPTHCAKLRPEVARAEISRQRDTLYDLVKKDG